MPNIHVLEMSLTLSLLFLESGSASVNHQSTSDPLKRIKLQNSNKQLVLMTVYLLYIYLNDLN